MDGPGIPCECPHCGNGFEAARSLAGGITNCPRCGKAVQVEGLRDWMWRILQAIAVFAVIGVTWLSYVAWGPGAAVVAFVVGILGTWLLSKAM